MDAVILGVTTAPGRSRCRVSTLRNDTPDQRKISYRRWQPDIQVFRRAYCGLRNGRIENYLLLDGTTNRDAYHLREVFEIVDQAVSVAYENLRATW
jgi:hypothetical protein